MYFGVFGNENIIYMRTYSVENIIDSWSIDFCGRNPRSQLTGLDGPLEAG